MKLKTRTNQPVYYKLPVSSDIQHMSDDLLNSLRVGDVVQKKTGNQKHCYIVTYKEEKHGICLSYFACGYSETISYDYTDGHWVFNSKDVSEVPSESDVKALAKESVESATSGTIASGGVLGLNSSGKLVKGSISGGTQLYKHLLTSLSMTGYVGGTFTSPTGSDSVYGLCIINNSNTKIANSSNFVDALKGCVSIKGYLLDSSNNKCYFLGIDSTNIHLFTGTSLQNVSAGFSSFTCDDLVNPL